MLPFLVNYRIMKCILDVEAFDESSFRRFMNKLATTDDDVCFVCKNTKFGPNRPNMS
jgi:hypothetical protein